MKALFNYKSPIRDWRKFIFLIQSRKQFMWCVGVWLAPCLSFLLIEDMAFATSIVLGTVVGTLPTLVMTLPASFTFSYDMQSNIMARLEEEIPKFGYINCEIGSGRSVWKVDVRESLRFKESKIVISRSAQVVCVEGPWLIISRLRNRLSEMGMFGDAQVVHDQ